MAIKGRKIIMKWKPTITKIELEQLYVDGSYFDGAYTVFNCWSGYRYYQWLWFKWKRKLHENKHLELKIRYCLFYLRYLMIPKYL